MTSRLSVLDLIPVSVAQSSADAIASSLDLAERADSLGYHRFWFAEHHNSLAGASTTPAVMIAAALGRTERIRLGAGGVMLPNHSPVIVAEQFAMLEALAPGRIDLGLGRAPGSDHVITRLLQHTGPASGAAAFPESVAKVARALRPGGSRIHLSATDTYNLHVTAHATGSPSVWVLGGSEESALLAARLGRPYAFAAHFGAPDGRRVIEAYRSNFRRSESTDEPYALVTANVSAADTREEAELRALPQMHHLVSLQVSRPPAPMHTIESALEALRLDASGVERQLVTRLRSAWIGGTGGDVAAGVDALARETRADEVMLHPVSGRYEGEPLDVSTGRVRTLELLARERGLAGAATRGG